MKTIYEILPESLDTKSCHLLCIAGRKDVSFLIKSADTGKILGLAIYEDRKISSENFCEQLKNLLDAEPSLNDEYAEVEVIYSTPECVLIPSAIFDREKIEDMIDLQHGYSIRSARYFSDELKNESYVNCYRVNEDVVDCLNRKFGVTNTSHVYSSWMNKRSEGEDQCYLTIFSDLILISVFVNNKCLLINRYSYKTSEDISYYLLAIMQQKKLEQIPVEISGFVEKNSNIYKELSKYFEHISFSSFPAEKIGNPAFNAYPDHYFTHLIELI